YWVEPYSGCGAMEGLRSSVELDPALTPGKLDEAAPHDPSPQITFHSLDGKTVQGHKLVSLILNDECVLRTDRLNYEKMRSHRSKNMHIALNNDFQQKKANAVLLQIMDAAII
ncbi:hypothetical protein H8959_011386, partial [Pygathrix nigripes]